MVMLVDDDVYEWACPRIRVDGRLFYLGIFATQSEAHATYVEAMSLLNGYDPVTNEIVGESVRWSNVWTGEMWTDWVNGQPRL